MPQSATKPFIDVLSGQRQAVPPMWMMRQAGRYLPEYREVRAKAGGFLDLCFNPELAAEVTLQPIRRFGFDAAIIFSDILVIPYALGRSVRFEVGEGPRLEPLDDPAKVATLAAHADFGKLEPVFEALQLVRGALDPKIALIGFCGAPWTVATYMVAGQGTPDQAPARMMAYRHPEAFAKIIDVLVENSIQYLLAQLEAGADALADLRHLGRRAAAGRVRALVGRADAAHRRRRARPKCRTRRSSAFPAAPARNCRAMSRRPASTPSASTGLPSRPSSASACRAASPCRAISIRWC